MSSDPVTMDRARYAALYGPTVGDRIRLADTELIIEIEKDQKSGGFVITAVKESK